MVCGTGGQSPGVRLPRRSLLPSDRLVPPVGASPPTSEARRHHHAPATDRPARNNFTPESSCRFQAAPGVPGSEPEHVAPHGGGGAWRPEALGQPRSAGAGRGRARGGAQCTHDGLRGEPGSDLRVGRGSGPEGRRPPGPRLASPGRSEEVAETRGAFPATSASLAGGAQLAQRTSPRR